MRFTDFFAVERDGDDNWFDREVSTNTPLYVPPSCSRKMTPTGQGLDRL
ncbi:hypothetical protein [Rathayibacter soli]|nr:hypothetical protein [Glaciibacter superstes]